MRRFTTLLSLAFALAAPTAMAVPTITMVVKEGDLVPGVGNISSGFGASENLAVNDNGDWLVESDTNNPDTTIDGVVQRGSGHGSGSLDLRQGQALTSPAGASISSFDSLNINSSGNSGRNFFLSGTAGTSFDSGIYYNTDLVIQESDIATAAGFSANTKYIGWFEAHINNSNDIFMIASVDDPAIASTVDRALVKVNPVSLTQTVYLKESDAMVPGRLVTDCATGPHDSGFRNNGFAIFSCDVDGATTDDGIVAKSDGSLLTVLAREGQPVPGVPGRTWGSVYDASLEMNDNGDWAIIGDMDNSLTTDDLAIFRNGTDVIAREGSSLAAIGGTFLFTGFGTGNVQIDAAGNVAWFGDWNDPDTTKDQGIFVNGDLIVQEGVTTVGGLRITAISAVESNFTMSDNGRWLMFEGTLENGLDGAFLVEIPEPATLSMLLAGVGLASRRRRVR